MGSLESSFLVFVDLFVFDATSEFALVMIETFEKDPGTSDARYVKVRNMCFTVTWIILHFYYHIKMLNF